MEPVRSLRSLGHLGDDTRVVVLLRRTGPLTIRELLDEHELAGWSTERVEAAVTAAWSQVLISVDADDRLVAL